MWKIIIFSVTCTGFNGNLWSRKSGSVFVSHDCVPYLFFFCRKRIVRKMYTCRCQLYWIGMWTATRIKTKERSPSEMFTYYSFVVFISTHHSELLWQKYACWEQVLLLLLAKAKIKYSCELSNFVIFDATKKKWNIFSI